MPYDPPTVRTERRHGEGSAMSKMQAQRAPGRVARRAAIAGMLLAGLVGAPPAIGYAPQPAVSTATAQWAWIVVRDATANVARAPGKNSGNSTGGTNYVEHTATGIYVLLLDGVQADHGNVLVTTLGSKPKICVPNEWGAVPGQELIDVRCFTRTGAPTDATFIVNWISASGTGGKLAYGLNFSPTSNCGGPTEQYVSNGGTIATCPAPNGSARWKVSDMGSSRGTVQVTPSAHRATDGDITAGLCDVAAFRAVENPDTGDMDEWIDVRCFETDGSSQIYREHDAWFMQGLGMKGVDRENVAYVFADRPGASSYTPDGAYRYNSDGGTNTVARLGVGRYEVKLPRMPLGGSAQVTAYLGSSLLAARHCVVNRIETTNLPQRVRVRCFNKDGELRDTKFTLAYAR
jgi:hypothetical protein